MGVGYTQLIIGTLRRVRSLICIVTESSQFDETIDLEKRCERKPPVTSRVRARQLTLALCLPVAEIDRITMRSNRGEVSAITITHTNPDQQPYARAHAVSFRRPNVHLSAIMYCLAILLTFPGCQNSKRVCV